MTALQYLRWMYRWNRPRLSVYRAALEALRSLRAMWKVRNIRSSSLELEYDLATYGDWMSDENQH